MKYIVILGDGMADYPIDKLNGKTPLCVANKPNIDALASCSLIGTVNTVPKGLNPGSDVANLSVMGFNPKQCYTGRSSLEAVSIGIDLEPHDVTFRANLVTLSGNLDFENKTMVDYSSGEISSADANILIDYLKQHIDSDLFKLYSGTSYRHCLVNKNGSTDIKLTPPHDISGKVIKDYLPIGENSDMLLNIMKKSHELLKEHPLNIERQKYGKNPANSLWLWGEATKPKLQNFKEKYGLNGGVISAVDLIKGIAKCSALDIINVPDITGTYKTNFEGKAKNAVNYLLTKGDFVYIHLEAPDECGHQGDLKNKIKSIELIDEKVVKYIVNALNKKNIAFRMLITPDHATPIKLMTHTCDDVPFILYDSTLNIESGITSYTEENCSTGINIKNGYTLMDKLIK